MGKAAGAVIAAFTMGGGVVALLGAVLGTYAEAVALLLVGAGLFASSSALGGKVATPTEVAEQA
jgi:hypothetical protein